MMTIEWLMDTIQAANMEVGNPSSYIILLVLC